MSIGLVNEFSDGSRDSDTHIFNSIEWFLDPLVTLYLDAGPSTTLCRSLGNLSDWAILGQVSMRIRIGMFSIESIRFRPVGDPFSGRTFVRFWDREFDRKFDFPVVSSDRDPPLLRHTEAKTTAFTVHGRTS